MLKKLENKKGFTLVELIIVIAILAIIMLIAIPNFSGIQQRMQVRADKSTAAQIGKAVRVWFTDYTTDKTLLGTAVAGEILPVKTTIKIGGTDTDIAGLPVTTATEGDKAVIYDSLAGIEGYISKGQKPNSLKDTTTKAAKEFQFYCVSLNNDATSADAKIVISICSGSTAAGGTLDIPATFATTEPDYDGSKPAVAYIEP